MSIMADIIITVKPILVQVSVSAIQYHKAKMQFSVLYCYHNNIISVANASKNIPLTIQPTTEKMLICLCRLLSNLTGV